MTPGVVLHEIGQLRQVSWWHSGWHMSSASEISPEISLSCHLQVIFRSSACHLHVVCTRLQSPKYFLLNTGATALLKIDFKLNYNLHNKVELQFHYVPICLTWNKFRTKQKAFQKDGYRMFACCTFSTGGDSSSSNRFPLIVFKGGGGKAG